jgi:succinate--hydroxymethylglutarate CoA-transferase
MTVPAAGPLTGTTILAVEQYGAGPFGSQFLGDLGADVIKIENPAEGGELARRVGPYYFSEGNSHFFQTFNRNKRSITLDLKSKEGQGVLHDLVRRADAVSNNLRGDQPEKLGLTYGALAEVNPRIVCAHLSAYGRTGPRKAWPGFDYLMQAEAGYLAVTGEPDGPPTRMGLSIVDYMTGITCAFGLVSGLLGARATGKGMDIDTSLFDTALHNLAYLATWHLNGGHVQGREPRSAHPSLGPTQLYRTRDGWIFIMCNKEVFWPALARAIDRPEWIEDARFATFGARLENRAELTRLIDDALSGATTAEWLARFAGVVPAAPVFDVEQALANPYVAAMGHVAPFTGGAMGEEAVRMLVGPVKVDGRWPPAKAGPAFGADTEDVLGAIGYDGARIEELRRKKVI